MATFVNNGDINFAGATWNTTGKADTLHASTNLGVDSAQPYYSSVFSGSNGLVDIGVIVYLNSCETTGGTLTVSLEQYTSSWATVASTTMTYNVTDTKGLTYVFFKFDATHTESNGAGNYRYKFSSSGSTSQEIFFRANGVSTTEVACTQVYNTTGTPAAGDTLYVLGYAQGATANPTTATVTMNANANGTAYGTINIGSAGVLATTTAASTTTYLEVAANITIYNNGTYTIGTEADPIPSTSTSTFEFNTTAADRKITVNAGGTFSICGASKFSTPENFRTFLQSTAAAAQKDIVCQIDVQAAGWAAGDRVALSATGTTLAQSEVGVIDSISGSTITLVSNLTNQHLAGGHIINLTRNVIITQSGANWPYIETFVTDVTKCVIKWARFDTCLTTADGEVTIQGASGFLDMQNCSFDSCGSTSATQGYNVRLGVAGSVVKNIAHWGDTKISGGYYLTGAYNKFTLENISFVKAPVLYPFFLYNGYQTLILKNCYAFDRISSTTNSGFVFPSSGGNTVIMEGCRCGLLEDSTGDGGAIMWMYTGGNYLYAYNCYSGSDGTNNLGGSGDIYFTTALSESSAYFYNCILNGTALGQFLAPKILEAGQYHVHSNVHNQTIGRYLSSDYYGDISDQVTGGQAESWARGGSGTCIYINPNSTTVPLILTLKIPVTASTNPALKFYVKKTSSASDVSMTVTVYDSDDNYTKLVDAQSVTLTDDWTQHSVTSISPTATGYCRVVLSILNGATTGDIGIDDISISIGGTTATDGCNNWVNGLPELNFDRGGGTGAGEGGFLIF